MIIYRFCYEISGGQYEVPTYDKISNKILNDMYDRVKRKIANELASVEVCGVTTDGWTSRQCFGYLSLTIHYVNEAFKLVTRTLAIKNITESQTGEKIKSKIVSLLNEWGLLDKAECITTDNGMVCNSENI